MKIILNHDEIGFYVLYFFKDCTWEEKSEKMQERFGANYNPYS